MNPEEIVHACLGELYRYRLAVVDQRERILLATEEVQAERQQIDADEYKLLFAPSMSREAFQEQLEAIHHRDIPLLWRLKTEGEFLLTAVYGIYTMAKAIRRASERDLNACVHRAIGDFETAAPDADLLRHLHVHSDSYIRGEGLDADRLPDPTETGAVAMSEDGPVYWIGGKLFVLFESADAADELAEVVGICIEPR